MTGAADEAWVGMVEGALNALVVGVAEVKVDRKTGAVVLTEKGDEDKRQRHPGFRLLNRVINSDHAVRIVPEGNEPMARVAQDDISAAAGRGGSGSTIEFPPELAAKAHAAGAFFAVKDGGEIREDRNVHAGVALGHELIHSDHAQRGVFRPNRQAALQSNAYGGWNEEVEMEEMRTVGLPGAQLDEKTDITENDLRSILELPQRVSYLPHQRNVDAKTKQDRERAAFETLTSAATAYNEWARPMSMPRVAMALDTATLRRNLSGAQGNVFENDELAAQIEAALDATTDFAPRPE